MIPTLTLPFDIEGVFSHGSRYYVPMQRRTAIVLAFAACSIFPSFLAGSDELNQRFEAHLRFQCFCRKTVRPGALDSRWRRIHRARRRAFHGGGERRRERHRRVRYRHREARDPGLAYATDAAESREAARRRRLPLG